MKQFVFVIALVTLACATDLPQNAEPSELQAQPRVFEPQIKEKIKALIEQLGDPIDLGDIKFQTEMDNMKLDLAMTGQISGISKYEIPNLKMSFAGGFKFSFTFVIPELNVDISSYNLTVSSNMLDMYGLGTIAASVKNLTLEGTGKLGSKGDGFMFLENIDVGLEIGDFKFVLTGWLDDSERSKMMSEIVQQTVPEILKVYEPEVHEKLTDLVVKFAEGKKIKFP